MTIVDAVATGFLGIVALAAGSMFGAAHGIAGPRLNLSPSIPIGLYVYVPGAVHRGEFVQACLPDALASYAVAHKILFTGGACANGSEPIVKVLAALPGDVVNVDRDVRVNGRTWPSSTIRSIDSRGRAVDLRLARGTFVVAAHSMLLLGLHPRSWDGRYFGALPSSAVTGRWFPILADKKVTL